MTATTNPTRSPDPKLSDLMNLSEVATALGVSLRTVRRRVCREGIPVFAGPDGRERLVERKNLDRWRGVRRLENYRAS